MKNITLYDRKVSVGRFITLGVVWGVWNLGPMYSKHIWVWSLGPLHLVLVDVSHVVPKWWRRQS